MHDESSQSTPKFTQADAIGSLAVIGLSARFYFAALRPPPLAQKTAEAEQDELQIARARSLTSLPNCRRQTLGWRRSAAHHDNPLKLESIGELDNRLAHITAWPLPAGWTSPAFGQLLRLK